MYKYILTTALIFLTQSEIFSQQNDLALAANDTIKTTENDTVKKRKIKSLQEISIHAKQQRKTVTAVRSGLKPMDNPQSLQTINNEVIEQQQSIRLSDVVKNANGVYVSSARGGAQESFFSRGYDMSANNMFKNGFRSNSGSMPEVASLDKVEILKGSSALLYGNVTPGGILNMVTKTPSFKSGGEISMQSGSNAFYKPTLDLYGPLSSSVAYRIVGSFEKAESFRDVVTRERYYLNPSVLFKATEKTEIILQGDYLHDNWTPDFGTGIIGKKIVDLPRNTYLGAKWSNGQTRQASLSSLIRHCINDNWKLNGNISLQDYTRKSFGTERIQPLANGDFARPLGKNNQSELVIGEQISLQGNFNTWGIKHQLFTGADGEYSFAKTYTYTFTPTNYDTVNPNIYDPASYNQEHGIPTARNTKLAKTDTNRFGIYLQDLISVTEKIKVLAGVRWSWQEAQVTNYAEKKASDGSQEMTPEEYNDAKKDAKKIDKAISPKIGLVYQPTQTMTLFGSYANSFTPNSPTTYDVNKKPLAPSIIDQYEAGVKTEFLKGKISANITLYVIENSNLVQMSPVQADGTTQNSDPNMKVLSGETKSKGIEVDFTARPLESLTINAGYSYNDMRFTDTNGLLGSFVEGDRIARTPTHTANTSFFYTIQNGFLKGLSIGSIANYIGDRIGGWNRDYAKDTTTGNLYIRDREIPVKGYVTIDASLGYTWKRFSVLCRLSNITNELNYTVHENYSVNPIAPRQVMTTLKYKF
ncbi:TonB-dependent siderophore receptor [Flavobacterium sp. H122]|uniref:TonB-dependent siderophore receptor n=1 Tax=Flavobacterium sp. H122 TaxID=2529860 RepID=UPI0010AB2AD8|nr:TonB-dependent siderophore receptor [Flavobacterium sp. H122]